VACLPDGRIVFPSEKIALPATIPDPHRGRNLFILTPGDVPQIHPVVREEDESRLPGRLDLFSLSPDGKYVAAPGSNDEVSVISLENAKIQEIQGKAGELSEKKNFANLQDLGGIVPSWRNAAELSYVVPAGTSGAGPKRGEFVLRSLNGEPRVISKTWTDGMTDGFLPRPKSGG
jgi:hypothetical protein